MSQLSRAFLMACLSLPSVLAFALPTLAPATSTYAAASWSPKPTSPPMQAKVDLFKRQNSFSVGADGYNTTVVPNFVCGYIGQQWSLGATCSQSSSCFWDQNSQIVGCCTTEGPCTTGIYTSCYDGSGVKGKDSPFVYTCAGSSSCYVNTYIGTSRSTYRQYGCGNKNMSTTIYQTFSEMPDTVILPIHYTTFDYGGGQVTTTPSSPTSAASATHSPTTTPITATKKTSTGIIAGGVVGGLAGLALFGTLILFCLRRHRTNQTPVYKPETLSSWPQSMAEKLPPSPYYQHQYASSQGGTTLVSTPRSPPSSDFHGSARGGFNDSPRSAQLATYSDPSRGHHLSPGSGSEIGSDYSNHGGMSAYKTYSPGTDGYGFHPVQQPYVIQEIAGRGVEAPRYEMEHTESEIVRKPVGSPRVHAR